MTVEYNQHKECEGCPYRDTEIIEEKMCLANEWIVHTELRCKNYFICMRIIEKHRKESPHVLK